MHYYTQKDSDTYFNCDIEQVLYADKYSREDVRGEPVGAERDRNMEAFQGYTLDPEGDVDSIDWAS
jgi:hypothetical protein